MKSLLAITLAIASIILGLYMLVINILNYQQKTNYHIGCYLSNPTFNQSVNLRQKIKQLEISSRFKRALDLKVRNYQLIDTHLHQKSVNLTKNVQQYIKKLTLVKRYQESNMQFFTQLSVARKNYQICASGLKQTFNTEQCKSLWQQYNKCFGKYSKQREDLQSLYRQRQNYLKQIDDLMIFNPSQNNQFDMQAELRIIKAKYDRLNSQNDQKKQDYISQLKKLQYKNQSKSNQYDQTQRQVARSKSQYEICLKNQKQFNKCQQIKKTIKQYGYSESTQSLQQRIRQKREGLMKMMQLIKQSQDNRAIRQMYDKRQQQLKHLIKLQIDMKFSQNRQCGCTESQKQELQRTYQNSKIRLSQTLRQLRQLTQSINQYQVKIKQTDKYRQNLINQFRTQTQNLANQNRNNGKSLKERLQILKNNVNKVNSNINMYNPTLNSLQFQCNQYKKRLSDKVLQSNKIADCLAKKNYYKQLSEKAQQILKKDDTHSQVIKNIITQILQTIHYPLPINIDQIREQAQINMITQQTNSAIDHRQQEQPIAQKQEIPTDEIIEQIIDQYATPSQNQKIDQANKPSENELNDFSQQNIESDQLNNDNNQKITIKVQEQVHVQQYPDEQIVEVTEKVTVDIQDL